MYEIEELVLKMLGEKWIKNIGRRDDQKQETINEEVILVTLEFP